MTESKYDILNELMALSPLLSGAKKLNVFTVPNGYFEQLSGNILDTLNEKNNFLNNARIIHSPGDVPQGYFDSLADSILARIKAEGESASSELRQLSSMLYSMRSENIFEVPVGYFEGFPAQTIGKIKPQSAKIISMHKPHFAFMKYAVAAAFTGILALSLFKFNGTKAPALPVYVADGLKHHDVDEELSKIPADDIIKYLQANGENIDVQTVANKTLDENELPSQADYLMDEKMLDKYLDNVDMNNSIN